MFKKGFTTVEMLVAVTIVGVIAALLLPAVISNQNSMNFSTGLKKAVNTINGMIHTNISKGDGTALDTDNLAEYLQKNVRSEAFSKVGTRDDANSEFYTNDHMRIEVPNGGSSEFKNLVADDGTKLEIKNAHCGTKGYDIESSERAKEQTPCVILVDVNGSSGPNKLTTSESSINDMFLIVVTDHSAFPYGELGQNIFHDDD